MKTITHNKTKLFLEFGKYQSENNSLDLIETKTGDYYTCLSTNLEGTILKPNEILIKNYSENEGILEILEAEKILKRTGKTIASGFVRIPICEIL